MSYAVVCWTQKGSTLLAAEQVEVLKTSKLAVEGDAHLGKTCLLQFNQQIWKGRISSLHKKQSDANQALNSLVKESSDNDDSAEENNATCSEDTTETLSEKQHKDNAVASKKSTKNTSADKASAVAPKKSVKKSSADKTNAVATKKSVKKSSADKTNAVATKKSAKKSSAVKTNAVAPKKSSTATKTSEEASLYNDRLADNILSPIFAQTYADPESSDDDYVEEITTTHPPPPLPSLDSRPEVGHKRPKASFPPRKCINVTCKEEKERLKAEIASLKEEIEELKSGSSQAHLPRCLVLTPNGEIDASEASRKGLSEIADGVWCCPVRVKALINSVISRTALACAMLAIFYPKDELKGKHLKELNQRIVNAIADFAVVAKLPEKNTTTEEGETTKKKKAVTKGEVLQALCQKCNQLIFQGKRPTYHQEKYQEMKRAKKETVEEQANEIQTNHFE